MEPVSAVHSMTLSERNSEHVLTPLILSAPLDASRERAGAVSVTYRRWKIPLGLSSLPCVQTTLSLESLCRGARLAESPSITDLWISQEQTKYVPVPLWLFLLETINTSPGFYNALCLQHLLSLCLLLLFWSCSTAYGSTVRLFSAGLVEIFGGCKNIGCSYLAEQFGWVVWAVSPCCWM